MAKATKRNETAAPEQTGTTNTIPTASPMEPAAAVPAQPAPDGGDVLTPGVAKGPEAGSDISTPPAPSTGDLATTPALPTGPAAGGEVKPLPLSEKIDWLLAQVPAGDDQHLYHTRRLLNEARAWAAKAERLGVAGA